MAFLARYDKFPENDYDKNLWEGGMRSNRVCRGWFGVSAVFALGLAAQDARGETIAEFYKDKTLSLLIGFTPGDGYDVPARLMARHLVEHIPGKPGLVPRNMTGAGGRNVMTHVYNIAPRDGTVIATIEQSLPLQQALGETFQFDCTQFTWIGNQIAGTNVLSTWHASGVKTIEDAKRREVTIGATGSGSSQQPKLMNQLLGTKFKIVLGYQGGSQINLAMERGEVDGRTNTLASYKSVNPDWLRDNKINILTQIALTKSPELPDVPLLLDLATNDDDRTLLKLISTSATIGRSIVSTPAVPAERAQALRRAFDATMKDPRFLEDAARAKIDFNPMTGETLERIVADIMATPKPLAERLAELIGGIGEGR